MENFRVLISLISWMKRQDLKYPWQHPVTPYRVWVSEVMLQQTVVSCVVGYFNRWMELYPTIRHLAQAKEVQVLRVFEGLGYYSRARNMHLCARILLEKYQGKLPDTYEQLCKLPGIGDYTARAILSLAYEKDYLVVDANVKRVLRRVFLQQEWTNDFQQCYLESLPFVSSKEKRYLNEGLMRLGQEVCLRHKPLCLVCPLQANCLAYKTGKQNIIKSQKRSLCLLASQLFLIVRNNQVLVQKATKKRFAHLYLFPKLSEEKKMDLELLKEMGYHPLLGKYTHTYTRFKEDLNVFFCILPLNKKFSCFFQTEAFLASCEWLEFSCLENCPLPSVYRRIWRDFLLKHYWLYNDKVDLGGL